MRRSAPAGCLEESGIVATSAQKTEAHARVLRSVVVVLSATGIYLLVFAPIYRLAGSGAGALSILPIICTGWLLGRRAAVAAVALAFVLNTLLYNLMGISGWEVVFRVGGGPGMLVALLSGIAAGWVRDLVARFHAQSRELVREREALREQETRLRMLIEQSPAIIWSTDAELCFTSSLGAGLAGLGLLPHQVVGMSLYTFLKTDDPNYRTIVESRRALAGATTTYEDTWRGNEYQVRIEPLLDVAGQVIGTVGTALDVTEPRRSEAAVRRRDAILEAVSFAAVRFLETTGWEQCIAEVLRRLGAATEVSRIYMFQNHVGDHDALLASQRYEWSALGITPQIGNPELQEFSFSARGFQRWEELLRRGEIIYGNVRIFPETERALLESHGVDSIAVVPIFVGQTWWGHIGFDQCGSERLWSAAEQDALRAAAGILGATIQREQAEATLRESERRYRDLLAAARRQTQELSLLDQVRGALARELDLPIVFRIVVEAIRDTFGYSHVSLYLLRDAVLYLQHQVGYAQVIAQVPITQGVIGQVTRSGTAVLIEDVRSDPAFLGAISGIVSEIGVPLFDQGQVVGVLNVESSNGLVLGEADLQLLLTVGANVNIVIERARLYMTVRESEQKYRSVVDTIQEVVFQLDAVGIWTFLNPAWSEITGFPVAETIGRSWGAYVYAEDHALARALLNPLLARERTEAHGELRFSTRSGELRWMEFFAHLTLGPADQVLGISGTLIDINDRKAADAERKALEHKLLETQKLESLGVLAGGIAHDFNNLLMAILGNAELALLDLPAQAPARTSVARIELAARRAAELTNQMLAYAGKGRMVIELFEMNTLVEEITALLDVSIAKTTTLQYMLAPQLPPIAVDATQIRQVIMNLVLNAAEAVGATTSTIVVATGVLHVDRSYLARTWLAPELPEGEYVFLEIVDDGPGMSAETLAKIFDPFFTTKFTGRGLGLAAVLGIVRGHGGALKVTSALGQGTTFTILLPAVLAEQAEAPALERADAGESPALARPVAPADAPARLLLVIDDEEGVRSVAARMLERFGFTVITAADGRAGVDLFRDNADSIAAVLLDLTMPRLDGEQTMREIQAIKPDVRVVIMSGYDQQSLTERFAGLGPAGFLQKPFQPATLRKTLDQVLALGE
jgi:PAS domain S-box-containing protein